MDFPLGIWDISLLLAFTAIILLITSALLGTYHGTVNLKIDRRRLRNIGLLFSSLFLATMVMKILTILLNI
jgi:hypothetical protein